MLIVLCEDEPAFADQLEQELRLILDTRDIDYCISKCSDGNALKKLLNEEVISLLFMDIQLGDEDGVELVKEINDTGVRIPTVFLTSMEHRIAEGYDVSAINFLFKRDYKDRLPKVLDKYFNEYHNTRAIVVDSHDTKVLLNLDEIYYAEPDNRNTFIHTAVSCYSEKSSIQNFAKHLPETMFIEVYHSLYINIDHVRKVETDSVILDNDEKLPVSRRKRKELMTAIMRRIQNR